MNIVFVGNCQAHSLAFIFDRYIGSKRGDTSLFVDGWNYDVEASNILLSRADIVVEQVFSGSMGVLLDSPPPSARIVRFPDVRGSFLWPFGNVPRIHNEGTRYKPTGPYDAEVGDSFLNKMIEQGVAAAEALQRYHATNVVAESYLPRVFELMIEQQHKRDMVAGMQTAQFIQQQLPHQRLFRTQGHLDLPLFNHLAHQVYAALSASNSDIEVALSSEADHPFEPFHDAPVHPAIIDYYNIEYLSSETRYYHVQEGRFTFDEFVLRYMRNDWLPAMHEACARLDDADHASVLAIFDLVLPQIATCGFAFEKKAHLLSRLGRWSEAASAMEEALTREPGHAYYLAVLEHYRHRANNG